MQSATVGGPAKGALFWQWYDEGQRAPAEEGGTVEGLFGEQLHWLSRHACAGASSARHGSHDVCSAGAAAVSYAFLKGMRAAAVTGQPANHPLACRCWDAGIFDTDSTWSIIQNFTDTMNALSGDLIAACAADAGAVLPVIDACVGTRVEGRPDTG